MSVVEIVAGGFASAAIRKFVDAAGGYLSGNYGLHKETKEMLENLKCTLPQMQYIMEVAEKQQIHNIKGLAEWAKLIKDVADEAEDVLDDFEAKSISQGLKGKGKVSKAVSSIAKGAKNSLLPDSDVKKLNAVVKKLEGLCQKSTTYFDLLKLDLEHKQKGPAGAESGELTQILPLDDPIIGRDNEIKFILSLILGYEIDLPEHGTSSQDNKGDAGPSNTADMGKELGETEQSMSSQKQEMRVGTLSSSKQTSHYGRPHVIPIVGICGVGKTFLAQYIYEHQLLEDRFHLKNWFCMSQISDVDKMLKALVPSSNSSDPHDLWKQLKSIIEGKRFFFVLDDVRSEVCKSDQIPNKKSLVDVLTRFNIGAYGSVILITTRENKVSTLFNMNDPIILNPLEWNYFLPLLEYYALQNVDIASKNRQAIKQMCYNVGRKLHGIPQAAKMIGNIIRFEKHDKLHWDNILRNPKFRHDKVFTFLEIAYQHLDANLKHCFAFCSILPTNIVERDWIIQLWIANNFIQLHSPGQVRSEDIGGMWFDQLVNMSFFLPTPRPNLYIVNSAMRELALGISSNEFFIFNENQILISCIHGCFLTKDDRKIPNQCMHGYSVIDKCHEEIPQSTRYLTIRTTKPTIKLGACSNNLRTLLFQSDSYESLINEEKKGWFGQFSRIIKKDNHKQNIDGSFLRSTVKLRVLELSCADDRVGMQIDAISQLPHLRFLDLSYSGITELPETISTLYHLQVLDIRGSKFEKLPIDEKITKLPKKMHHLINLRHLCASKETISLIYEIGELSNLQELEEFRITQEKGHTISELAEMNEISGRLSIVGLENVKDEVEAGEAKLLEKEYLKVLFLRWDVKDEVEAGGARLLEKEYLEVFMSVTCDDLNPSMAKANKILNSIEPNSAVEELEIENFLGTKLPAWTTLSLLNMRRIYLKSCHQLRYLPALGELPYLETLVLEDLTLDSIGKELYGLGTPIFPELKVLKFLCMYKWEIWSPSRERELLPCLEELEIHNCPALRQTPLPSLNLSCLKKLELSRCTGVLQEGSLSDKKLPLLNSLCISHNSRITLVYQNVPNLKLLSLHWTDARFTGDGPGLLNLKSLILDNCCVPWNRGMILRSLTKLEMNGYHNDILEMSHSSLPSLKVLKLNCSLLLFPDSRLIRERHLLEETKEYRAQLRQRTDDIEAKIQDLNDEIEESIRRFSEYTNQFERIVFIRECIQLNEKLSSWFKELPHLVELNLDIRGLTEFPSTLATHVSLKSLTLTGRGLNLQQEIDFRRDTILYITDLRVQSLPESGMPPNLKALYIKDASDQLQQRCSKEQGEDWHKIAHIPYIRVNNSTLQML